MNYGDIDSFGIANTKNITELAEQAGFTLNVYNLKYPSETEPLTQARASALKGDKGVIRCDPGPVRRAVQDPGRRGMHSGRPAVRLRNIRAELRCQLGRRRNADRDVARGDRPREGLGSRDDGLVQCTNPDYGPSVNAMFETAPPAVIEAGFAIPEENVFNLTCKLGKHETVTTDWFTAHPDFANIMFDTVDDPSADGMINAIKKAGREDDSIIIVNGADPQGREAIRAGTQTGSTAFFPERYGEWAIAMLEDILAGVPVPLEVNHPTPLITIDNIDEYYPGE